MTLIYIDRDFPRVESCLVYLAIALFDMVCSNGIFWSEQWFQSNKYQGRMKNATQSYIRGISGNSETRPEASRITKQWSTTTCITVTQIFAVRIPLKVCLMYRIQLGSYATLLHIRLGKKGKQGTELEWSWLTTPTTVGLGADGTYPNTVSNSTSRWSITLQLFHWELAFSIRFQVDFCQVLFMQDPRCLLKSPLMCLCLYKYPLSVAQGPVFCDGVFFWHTFRVCVELTTPPITEGYIARVRSTVPESTLRILAVIAQWQ